MNRCSVVLGACLMAMTAVPETAEACLHGKPFRPRVDPRLRNVKQAEQLLAQGKHDRATRLAKRAFDDLDRFSIADSSLRDRAQRVVALAAVRSEGAVGPMRARRGERPNTANVMWAAVILQFHAARSPDNTLLQTDYAEAVVGVPFMQGVAFAILSRLSEDDLMPHARGYTLLARLQKQRGDDNGLALSLARCNDIAGAAGACQVA
jgi:hypothetical protein